LSLRFRAPLCCDVIEFDCQPDTVTVSESLTWELAYLLMMLCAPVFWYACASPISNYELFWLLAWVNTCVVVQD
jgi:hypothetical protein